MTSASTTGASRGREGGREKGGRGRKFEMGKSVLQCFADRKFIFVSRMRLLIGWCRGQVRRCAHGKWTALTIDHQEHGGGRVPCSPAHRRVCEMTTGWELSTSSYPLLPFSSFSSCWNRTCVRFPTRCQQQQTRQQRKASQVSLSIHHRPLKDKALPANTTRIDSPPRPLGRLHHHRSSLLHAPPCAGDGSNVAEGGHRGDGPHSGATERQTCRPGQGAGSSACTRVQWGGFIA